MKKPSIMIDAGHGGKDSGAVGTRGTREKDVALSVALLTAAKLRAAGVDVLLTREDDRFLELAERARMANEAGADLFLSIHCNSAANRAAEGFEVYTTRGETAADPVATNLFQSFGAMFPHALRRVDVSDGDPDKEADFAVLRLTRMPAVLFELEFISSEKGEAFLADPANHILCAEALTDGMLMSLGVAAPAPLEPPKPNPPPAETNADAAAIWQTMRAGGNLAESIARATNRTLRELRSFLLTQLPDGLIGLGLGLVELEVIERFLRQDDSRELEANFKQGGSR